MDMVTTYNHINSRSYPLFSRMTCLRFDKNVIKQAIAMAPLTEAPKTPAMSFWENEPEDLDGLLARYNIEVKVPGRHAGTTLFYVPARDRSHKTEASLLY